MNCRPNCGACCVAPSINRPFFGMPQGKPAGMPCVHLADNWRCLIFTDPRRPEVCASFQAEESICGSTRDEALETLIWLESATLVKN